ncbi:MAG TPA: MFS transporter [Candidatus Dormibacteraeota bacterium]|nr:MFS transporter [Candidatus Dormibacteraeota bacterium]
MTTVAGGFNRTFASLRNRNFRIFFTAQIVSVTGTWMQSIAQMWLVLHLTGSGIALGITAALQFTPILLFGTWGGLLADRVDKRKLLMVTQSAAGLVALVLAGLTLGGVVQLWMVYLLAFSLGMVNVFDNPGRQSFVTEMVGKDQVINAVGLNSAVFTLARVIGPAIAGVLIAAVGTGWCFLYNGLSYFPVVFALVLMHPWELHRGQPTPRARGQIRAGISYAWNRPELRFPLLLMLVVGTLAFNFSVLMPLMASFVFHSGASTFGLLMSFMGAGAFVGALVSASRAKPSHRLLAFAGIAFGALLIGAALAPTLPIELLVLLPLGAAMITFQATANSLLQLNSDPAFRGRVMALYVMVFLGSTPIGGPIVGWVAEQFGARTGLGLGGIATFIASVALLWALGHWRVGQVQPSHRPMADSGLAAGAKIV